MTEPPAAQRLRRAQPSSQFQVVVDQRLAEPLADAEELATLLSDSLQELVDHATPAEVGLAFVGVDEMAGLNESWMGGSGPTDVLAFPIDGASAEPGSALSLIGDIVICPEVAARAPQPVRDELRLLVVHGALHLVGHDHAEAEERRVMQALERELLERHPPAASDRRGEAP